MIVLIVEINKLDCFQKKKNCLGLRDVLAYWGFDLNNDRMLDTITATGCFGTTLNLGDPYKKKTFVVALVFW